jgi:hypothetical protein
VGLSSSESIRKELHEVAGNQSDDGSPSAVSGC